MRDLLRELWGGMFKCGEGGRRLRDGGVAGGMGVALSIGLVLEMMNKFGGSCTTQSYAGSSLYISH